MNKLEGGSMKYEKLIKTLDRWLSDFDKDVITGTSHPEHEEKGLVARELMPIISRANEADAIEEERDTALTRNGVLAKERDLWEWAHDKNVKVKNQHRSNDDGEEFYFIALAGLIIGTAEGATRVEAIRNLREKVK